MVITYRCAAPRQAPCAWPRPAPRPSLDPASELSLCGAAMLFGPKARDRRMVLEAGQRFSAARQVIAGWRLETDHGFPRLGVAESFARQALDRSGIAAQSFDGRLQLLGGCFLLLDLIVEHQDSGAHSFVLFDDRQVGDGQAEQARETQEENNQARQLAPNAKINVHRAELSGLRRKSNANSNYL